MAGRIATAVQAARAVPNVGAGHVGRSTATGPSTNPRGLNKPEGFDKAFGAFKSDKSVMDSLPAPKSTTLPWDAQAQAESNDATTRYTNAEAGLAGNWASRESFYGFGDNGANNPYSQAALLATHHEWNERGRSNASGLHAFDGSNVNARNEEANRYASSYEQLLQAYEAEKAQKTREEEAAQREYEDVVGVDGKGGSAQLGAIQRASEAEPAPIAPAAKKQEPDKKTTPKKKKGK
jgi:hypothetical protein